jgi:hypothetical protein
MTRLEQRGAVAFTGCRDCRGGDPANHAVGISVLADDAELASLPWVLDQSELLHLLAYLVRVSQVSPRSS